MNEEVSDQDTIKVGRMSNQSKQIQFQIQSSQKVADEQQSVDLQDQNYKEEMDDLCELDNLQKNKKSIDLKQSLAKVKANQNFFGNSSVQDMLKSSLKENMIQSIDNKQFFQKYKDRKKFIQSSQMYLDQSEQKKQESQKQSVNDMNQYLNSKQQQQMQNIQQNIKTLNGLMTYESVGQNQDYQQFMDYGLIDDLNLFNQQLLNVYFGIQDIILSYQNIQMQLFKYHLSQKQPEYMDINECVILARLYLVDQEYDKFDKLIKHIDQIVMRNAEYESENERSVQTICDIMQGWKYLLYHQQANILTKKIYLSKAQKHFESIQVTEDIMIQEGYEASLFLGAILVEFNNMFSTIDKTIEYGEQLMGSEYSDTSTIIQILLNVILLNQKNNDEQYAGMINIIESIKQLDDHVIFLMNLMFNYFKKSKFQDNDSYAQLIQIGMARIDIFSDIDLEILKTLNLKYLYSQEPFDLNEFFQEYEEQDNNYPVYQVYQNYYLIKFIIKHKILNDYMDLVIRSIKNLNKYQYLIKDSKTIIKIESIITKVYDQFQLQNFNYIRLQNVIPGLKVSRNQNHYKKYQNLVQKQKQIQQQKDMLHQIYLQQQYQNLELVSLQQQLFKLINHCFSFSSSDDDQMSFPNIANQMMNQLQSVTEFRADILIAIFILLQYFVKNFLSKSDTDYNQNLIHDLIMISHIIEQNYKPIMKIYNNQLSLDLQKMGSMLYGCINIIDKERIEEIIAYLYYKCLKKQQKPVQSILSQMKVLFYEDIKNSFYLNYILLKTEFKQSNCLDEDYNFKYYEDISEFVQKFKFMKKIVKQIIKQKQDFYIQNQEVYNKIYYFYRQVEL